MRNLNSVQDALINIFKVGIKGKLLEELVKICHIELEKLIGKDKTKNFFLAVHLENSNYILPYYKDEKDADIFLSRPISLKGGLTEYIRLSGQTELLDLQRIASLEAQGKIAAVIGAKPSEWIGAPLIYGSQVHGILAVYTYNENVHYTQEDVDLIDSITRSIALVLERNDKDRQLMKYRENLEKEIKERSKELLKKNTALKREIAKVKQMK